MPLNLNSYVDDAVRLGREYINENLNGPRLQGSSPEETAQIAAFLQATPHPYEALHVRMAVAYTLNHIIGSAVPAEGERDVVYLAGGIGSCQKLLDAAADKNICNKEIGCLRHLREGSVLLNFPEIQELFSQSSGEILDPYAKWRGQISGITQVARKYADQIGSSVVQDDTLTGFTPAEIPLNVAAVRRSVNDGNKVHVFAILLTPDEAEAMARKQAERMGRIPQESRLEEARRTAKLFKGQWEAVVKPAQNATILESDLRKKPVFVKRDNEILIGGVPCPPCGGNGNSGYQMPRRDPG